MLVLVAAEDTPIVTAKAVARAPVRLVDLERLTRPFSEVTLIGVAFTMAWFNEAFPILKARAEGLPVALTPMVLVVMNPVYAIEIYPAGRLSVRVPAQAVLVARMACVILPGLSLALLPGLLGAFVRIALWRAHIALTPGLLTKLAFPRTFQKPQSDRLACEGRDHPDRGRKHDQGGNPSDRFQDGWQPEVAHYRTIAREQHHGDHYGDGYDPIDHSTPE